MYVIVCVCVCVYILIPGTLDFGLAFPVEMRNGIVCWKGGGVGGVEGRSDR